MPNSAETARSLRQRYDDGDPGAIEAIKQEAAKYRFYHRLEVVPGVSTGGLAAQGYKWADKLIERIVCEMKRIDFAGRRVLDIGCRDGLLSFTAEQLGAAEVVGIDNDLSSGLTNFLIPFRGSRVSAVECNVNDLTREAFGQFDIVIFAGVLYHLRYPIWALRRIADVMKPGATLLIEGGFMDGLADLPVMFCPSGTAGSPYGDASSVTFFNEAGLTATLTSLGFSNIQCRGSFSYMSRLYTARRLAAQFPRFVMGNWWRLPRVCRKIFVCEKGAQDADIVPAYWNATHNYHSGKPLAAGEGAPLGTKERAPGHHGHVRRTTPSAAVGSSIRRRSASRRPASRRR